MIRNGKHQISSRGSQESNRSAEPRDRNTNVSPSENQPKAEIDQKQKLSKKFAFPILASALAVGVILGILWKRK